MDQQQQKGRVSVIRERNDTSPQSTWRTSLSNVRWDRHVFKTVTVSRLVFVESVCVLLQHDSRWKRNGCGLWWRHVDSGASQHCKIDSDCITDICNPNTKQCDVFTEIDQCSNQDWMRRGMLRCRRSSLWCYFGTCLPCRTDMSTRFKL